MRLYIIVHKIRRMDMQQIILGSAGFLLYFIYDINSVRKQNRYLQKFFAAGTILVVLSLFMELWFAWGQCSHKIGRMIGFGIGAMCLPRESTQPRTNSAGRLPLAADPRPCFSPFLLRKPIVKKTGYGLHTQKVCMDCVGIPVFCGLQVHIFVCGEWLADGNRESIFYL